MNHSDLMRNGALHAGAANGSAVARIIHEDAQKRREYAELRAPDLFTAT